MPEITTRTATIDLWDDIEHALTGGGDGKSCWCQWWFLTNAQFSAASSDDKREGLREQLKTGLPRAIVGYVDGEPAGWCRVAPRTEQARLLRTQLLKASEQALDDADVWAIDCLVVRREYRGMGLTAELVEAAIALADDNGARVIEAYPVDTAGGRASSNELYHGTVSIYTAAGFREVARPKPARLIMELTRA